MSSAILGINFGQSYASIAVIDKEGHPECIANEEGERQIACAISYSGEQIYIGNGAKPFLVKNGQNTIMGFRNLLGHTYDEVDHTAIFTAPLLNTSEPSYEVDVLVPAPTPSKGATPAMRSAAPSGTATPAVQEPIPAKKTITVPEVTTLFLSTLFTSASDYLGVKPTQCVISAPSWFTSKQHTELRKAAEAAGINVLQVLDEAAAVLVGYRAGLTEERAERGLLGDLEAEKSDKKVAVLDVGETSVGVSVVAVSNGEYSVLAKGRDDKIGGREFDNLLLKHFAKEFTKKTKTALDLPCAESASAADKRAEAKLRLAVEHTKRSLSASTGAATCAVESLKDGLDLSTSINRMRFDALAGPVYRQIGAALTKIVEEAGLDLAQIDEVLLAGASTLFPGLQSSLTQIVQETTVVSATIDPSQVIAIGCALQALHLSQLPAELALPDVLALAEQSVPTLAAPIGLAPAGSKEEDAVKIIEAGAPLPTRRRLQLPTASGASTVGVELYELKESVKVTKIPPPPKEEGEEEYSDEEPEEDEEEREVVLAKAKCLGGVTVDSQGKGKVELEVIVTKEGKGQVRFWVEGAEDKASRLEF